MKANELRIGNWVNEFNRDIEVSMSSFICQEFRPNEDIFEDFKPIPITEEWLIRFGFKKDNDYPELWNFNKFWIEKVDGGFDYNETVLIKHVNQLQNLYFALTGEELKIK